jgi:hypothetical protein
MVGYLGEEEINHFRKGFTEVALSQVKLVW